MPLKNLGLVRLRNIYRSNHVDHVTHPILLNLTFFVQIWFGVVSRAERMKISSSQHQFGRNKGFHQNWIGFVV